ncbi:MAG TPA: trigger factor [Caulobacteraceae bacterium]|jgi:trigger factor|nr:trigger factor [Caulobacteraceae bacterium]
MEVVEKTHEGLSRSYAVRVPASDLGAALDARIAEILPTLNLKGFRPGKVPAAHVRRMYGKALMGEVVEKTLNETSQQVLSDNQLRIAAQPDLKPVSDMDQVLAGREDLAYDLDVEVMPEFEPMNVEEISLERLVYEPEESEVDEAMERLVAESGTFEPRTGKKAAAQGGDQVVIDFIGRIDGEAFEGGSANDAELILGSGQFIPGFEGQLVGTKAGDTRDVTVSFPEDYQVDRLKGKEAVFAVEVKEVRAPKAAEANDELAKNVGFEDLAGLRNALRENLGREYKSASRFKLKRALLDALDSRHEIPLPPRMVEAEFAQIWAQVEKDRAEGAIPPEDAGKSEETLRQEYQKIAERRVRLGLVLAEIGRRASVTVSDAELGQAMRAEAMRYGNQAAEIFELMRNNPNIQATLRAPIYEDKVVDLILEKANVADKAVSKEELLRDDDLPEGFSAGEGQAASDASPAASEAEAPKKARKPRAPKAAATEEAKGETAEAAATDAAEPAEPAAKKPRKPRAKAAASGEGGEGGAVE